MKLYYGGFGRYQYYTVAKDHAEANQNIQNTYNLQALPVTVQEINEVDGYEIVAKPKPKAKG